jgi:hypothetical protein
VRRSVRARFRRVIQEWLGHRSITVTIDVYGHLFPSLNEAMALRLDDVFQKAAEEVDYSARSVSGDVVALSADHKQTTSVRAKGGSNGKPRSVEKGV